MVCHCGLDCYVLLLFVILHVLRLHTYLFYLGLNDRAVERGYTWSDGSPVTFINWHSSEPSNNFYDNCIEMYQNSFQWNDLRCIEARGYICKQPLGKQRPMFLLRVPAFVSFSESKGGAVVRALAFHQCGPGSNRGVHTICELSVLLVLSLATRGFSPGTPVFPSP